MIDHNHPFSKIRAYQVFVKTGKTTRGTREGWELRVFRPKGKTDKCRIYSPSILWYD